MYRMSFLFRSGTDVNTPREMTLRSILTNHNSTRLSQDEYVGVKCRVTLGWSARNSSTRWVLWAERLSRMTWISLPGLARHDGARGHGLSAAVAVDGMAQHVAVRVGAAYKDNVPCQYTRNRALKWPGLSNTDPGDRGLDRGLLVNAKHRGVLGRIEVQPDHVGAFFSKWGSFERMWHLIR
jgi:hypothetical protein